MSRPASRSGRLRHARHDRGLCSRCKQPVTRDPLTHKFPWECATCHLKRYATQRRSSEKFRETCKAKEQCLRCGRDVKRTNPNTGLTYVYCDNCRRIQSEKRRVTKDESKARDNKRVLIDATAAAYLVAYRAALLDLLQ